MTNEAIPDLPEFNDSALDKAFATLEKQARDDAAALGSPEAVEAFRLEWLGRKQGRLNEVSGRWLKAAPPEAKKALGQRFNALKALVEELLDEAAGAGPSDAALAAEAIDITLPGTQPPHSAPSIPSPAPSTRSRASLRRWATRSASAPRSKPTTTTSSA